MDHPLDEHVVETEKYAFLLGCSLRENNLEQFFSVYDAILPKHLSESKLDKIKEEARQISELPQHSFDELVASARDFSLAQGRPKMSSLDGTLGPTSPSEDDDDGTDGYIHGDRIFLGLGDNADVLERDSGLPSSGKGTGSLCDMDGSDYEERGVYDYFPTQESNRRSDTIKISHTTNPDYDEVHDVESDKSSIESPRSDASSTNEYNVTNPPDEEGIEMKVFERQEETYSTRNIHTSFRHEIPYQVLRNDSDDDECRCTTVHDQRKYVRDCTMSRSVDDTVHFLTARNQDGVDSRDFQKHDSYVVGRQPPFGVEHQLRKVGGSIGKLLSSTGSAANMPLGSEIDDRKKKNLRKKKGSKDDADERVGSSKSRKSCMSDDENGNPIDISAYRQMRELPNKSEGSVDSSGKHPNYGTYTQHGENSNFDVFPMEGHNSGKHCEEGPSNADRKKLRKKTHRDQKCSLAEDIPNYVGNIASVDDLVKFIETDKFGEKQLKKKISQKTSPTSEPAVKAEKITKKPKDKKLKVGQLEESFDVNFEIPEVVIHPTSALCEAPLSPPPAVTEAEVPVSSSETTEVFVPNTTDTSPGEGDAATENTAEVMGNSGEKAAVPATEVESQVALAGQETTKPGTTESKVVHTKDSEPPLDTNSSSKSPPLHKEIEHREKSKNKHKDKEKDKPTEAAQAPPVLENKKLKSKNGKAEGQLKNNKKIENRNDIINDSKMVEKMKVENGPVKTVSALDNELSIPENHQYIFTDIDNLPPVEQEFTLVSKKKKRQGAKEGFLELPRPRNSPREHRGGPPPRSVTPPPSSSSSAIKEQTRDLSPSSFPALGKKGSSASKGRPTFREGRRNSFGDVPIDTLTELRSQDDSDIESVKSLPAAKGGSLSDVVSSRFPVSYARMAAAPKLPYSPTSPHGEEEEEFEDEDQESGSSRKPTVWKGSPTERRHSIGSSPEDSKQENSPKLTQRSRQKSGSQEFLLLDTMKVDNVQMSATIDLKAKTPIDVQLVSMSSTVDNYIPDDERTNESPQELHNSSSNESLSIPTLTLDAVTLAPNKVSGVIYKSDNNMVPKNGPSRRRLPQRTSKAEVVIAADLSRSQSTVGSALSSKDPRGKPVPVPLRVGNNCRKNNKSVIFMDKRFDDTAENLGITFGFDSNMEDDDTGTIIPSRHEITYSVTMESSSCDTKELVHNQTEPQSISQTILPKDSSTKSDQSAVPPTSQPSTRTTLNNVGGTTDLPDVVAQTIPVPNNKVSKTRVAGLNGVVQPKTQGYKNSQTPDALRTERVSPAVRPAAASEPTVSPAAAPPHLPPVPAPASNNKDNKTVLFFYGEGIVAKMGKSGVAIDSQDVEPPSQHKGQLAFSPDPNHRGKFNINEAVKYLRQEWDRVLDQRDKNPQAVQYYNGQ